MSKAYGRKFYTEIVEHFFRLGVRCNIEDVKEDVVRGWHAKVNTWLDEKCTSQEAILVREYYKKQQTAAGCASYMTMKKLTELISRFASDNGLK